MITLHEAFMRCGYCGSRVVLKLRPDEVVAIRNNRLPKRQCDFCAGTTEWHLLEWKGSPPSESTYDDNSGMDDESGPKRPPDRILVIDDDDLTAILLRKVLESENCVLDVANDGKEGLQKLMTNRYSLVICDVHMPNMDGKKLFRFVDEQAMENKNNILFITGDTSAETRKFLESTGCHYMHKPIQVLQFASRIREILDAQHAEHA